VLLIAGALVVSLRWLKQEPVRDPHQDFQDTLASTLEPFVRQNQYPERFDLSLEPKDIHVHAAYTIRSDIQNHMQRLFERYRPDYGAFAAIDAKTGRVLALFDYQKNRDLPENLALSATVPAASIFKVITAAALFESGQLHSDSVIAFNGSNHSLYRRNVKAFQENRWSRRVSVEKAFAKSINTVFGKMGLMLQDPTELVETAERFYFNQDIETDLPFETGNTRVPQDSWEMAELASGFNRVNTLSPLQGALMGASIINGGWMMKPYVVQTLYSEAGSHVYSGQTEALGQIGRPETTEELRKLFRATVMEGTSRRFFRKLSSSEKALVEVGGKTGSLTGNRPRGKTDWFVGYVQTPQESIGFAVLSVHKEFWTVKSSELARQFTSWLLRSERAPASSRERVLTR
jgi:peptidoglycan glycosyltransferase